MLFGSVIAVLVSLISLAPASVAGAEGGPGTVLDVEALIAEALRSSPSVAAADAEHAAAGQKISQAGSFPDPMVSVGYQNDGWDRITFGERPMSNLAVSVTQNLPFPGKRDFRREGARSMESVSAAMARMTRVNVVKTVRERYTDLVRTGEMLDVLGLVLREVERVEEIATARYGAGVEGMQDVLMAQGQKYRILETVRNLEDERRRASAELWEAAGRDEYGEAGKAPPVSFLLPAATLETTVELALNSSPLMEKSLEQVSVAEANLKLADRNRFPDLTVTGMYAARNSSDIHDLWRVGVGTTIPLFYRDKQAAAVNEARHRLSAARQELEQSRQSVRAMVQKEWSVLERSEELMGLYEGGLKQKSLEGLEASLTAYRNGKADMTMVLRNLVDSMNAEIGYWKHFAARQMAVARLAALAGFEGSGGLGDE